MTEAPDYEDPIDEVAANWLTARAEGFSSAQKRDFDRWCRADPRHGAAVARLEAACALLEKMPLVRAELLPVVEFPAPLRAPRVRRGSRAAAASGARFARQWTDACAPRVDGGGARRVGSPEVKTQRPLRSREMKKVWRPMDAARHSASRTLKRLPGCRTPGGQREGSGGVVGRGAGASNRRGVRVEAEVCEDGDDCVAGSPRPPPPPWRTAWCGLRSQARVQRPFGDGAVATKTGVDLDWARVGGEGFELDPTLFGVELEEQLRCPHAPCRCGFAPPTTGPRFPSVAAAASPASRS